MCPLLRWASSRGRPPRYTRQGTDRTLPFTTPLPFGGWRPHKGGGLAWEIAFASLHDDHKANDYRVNCQGGYFFVAATIFGGFDSTPSSLALTLPGGGRSWSNTSMWRWRTRFERPSSLPE